MDAYKIMLSLVAFSSLLLGFGILRKDPKRVAHWFFLLKSLILAVFAVLAIAIQYADTPGEAQTGYKYYTLAMLVQPLTFYIFYSLLIPATRFSRILRRVLTGYFALIFLVWAGVPPAEFCEYSRVHGFWIVSSASDTWAVNFQVVYITLVPLILFLYLLAWHIRCKTKKEKHHSRLVLISLVVIYTLSFLADCLHIRVLALPHITPLLFFIYLATVYYSHIHYYFLDNDLGNYLEDMLNNSSDMFIFLNRSLKVEKINAVVSEELQTDERDLLEREADRLFQDQEDLKIVRSLAGDSDPGITRKIARLRFRTESGPIAFRASINRMEDRFGDFIGIHIFARTNKETAQFQRRHGITPKQMEIFHMILKGLTNAEIAEKLYISRRTVETHIAALYSRLNVSNKIELLNLARESGFR